MLCVLSYVDVCSVRSMSCPVLMSDVCYSYKYMSVLCSYMYDISVWSMSRTMLMSVIYICKKKSKTELKINK